MTRHYAADELRKLLPHRPPFCLLDSVEVTESGVTGVGRKNISISDPIFAGHFPDLAIYPGVLLIEAVAHTVGIVHSGADLAAAGRVAVLVGVRKFSFKVPVRPGDVVEFHVKRRTVVGDLFEYHANLIVENRLVASGQIAIAIRENGDI